MDDSLPLLSLGRRCLYEGFGFHWDAGQPPYLVYPNGSELTLEVEANVPYIPHQAKKFKRSTPSSPPQAPVAGVTEASQSKPSKDGQAKVPEPGPRPTVVKPVLGEPGPSGAHAPVGELDYEPSYPDSDDYPREDALEVVEPRLTPPQVRKPLF